MRHPMRVSAAGRGICAGWLPGVSAGRGQRKSGSLDGPKPLWLWLDYSGSQGGGDDALVAAGDQARHRTTVAVELGDAGRALRAAGAVDVSGLSSERRARMLIDVARAHAQRRGADVVHVLEDVVLVAGDLHRALAAVA
jgi:hypothetical protein